MDELSKATKFITKFIPEKKISSEVKMPLKYVSDVTRLGCGGYMVKVAGLSGAAAVLLAAYGAHGWWWLKQMFRE